MPPFASSDVAGIVAKKVWRGRLVSGKVQFMRRRAFNPQLPGSHLAEPKVRLLLRANWVDQQKFLLSQYWLGCSCIPGRARSGNREIFAMLAHCKLQGPARRRGYAGKRADQGLEYAWRRPHDRTLGTRYDKCRAGRSPAMQSSSSAILVS
jgi:hypothetical protein